MTDKQTNRQTDRQTNTDENITSPIPILENGEGGDKCVVSPTVTVAVANFSYLGPTTNRQTNRQTNKH